MAIAKSVLKKNKVKKTSVKTKSKKKETKKKNISVEEVKISDKIPLATSKLRCEDCKRVLSVNKFYKNSTTTTGYYTICIDCMRKRALDPESGELTKFGLTALLQIIDKPFISDMWDNLKEKPIQPEIKIANYIRSMSMAQNIGKTFKDSDANWSVDEKDREKVEIKTYSSVWKGEYSKREIEILNAQFEAYKRDFVITDASQEDYTRKICKASLELDECTDGLRNGSVSEARYKLAKDTFDSLSKSAKFAKSQRGDDASVGCFGQVFDMVEKNIWVDPYIPEEEDVYDKLISQLSNINRSF